MKRTFENVLRNPLIRSVRLLKQLLDSIRGAAEAQAYARSLLQ
jgi:hypothetical protein